MAGKGGPGTRESAQAGSDPCRGHTPPSVSGRPPCVGSWWSIGELMER